MMSQNPRVLSQKAQKHLNAGRPREALELLTLALHNAPLDPRILIPLARAADAAGSPDDALDALRRAAAADPRNPAPLVFLGVHDYDRGMLQEALAAFDACLAICPANALAASWRALCLYRLGKREEALAFFRANPLDNNTEYLIRFCSFFESHFSSSSIQDHTPPEYPETPPLTWRARRRLIPEAIRFLGKKQYQQAAWKFASAREHDPLNHTAVMGLSIALAESGCPSHALEVLLQYWEKKEAKPLPVMASWLGQLYLRLKRPEDAAAILELVAPEGPEDYNVHYYLAVACLLSGRPDRSREAFLTAIHQFAVDTLEDCILPLLERVRTEG